MTIPGRKWIERKWIVPMSGVFFILIVILGGCGYRFSGGGNLPLPNKRLCINIFENRTAETGLENAFTNAFIYEFSRHGNIALTCDEDSGGRLDGIVKSMRIQTISRKGIADSLERRVTLTVDVHLTGADGQVVWTSGEMSLNEEYAVTPDKLNTELNRGAAISELSKRFAETVYNRLIFDF